VLSEFTWAHCFWLSRRVSSGRLWLVRRYEKELSKHPALMVTRSVDDDKDGEVIMFVNEDNDISHKMRRAGDDYTRFAGGPWTLFRGIRWRH
jgi:hypothetical protein